MVDRGLSAARRVPGRPRFLSFLPSSPLQTLEHHEAEVLFLLQYKFRVDGEWRYDPLAPLARDQEGNLNNVLELLDPQIGYELPADFDAPPSPVAR